MAVTTPSRSYYFNEVRKICTDHEQVPVTWSTIRDADGQRWVLRKVIRIFLWIIPALVKDLYRMAVNALTGRVTEQPTEKAASPPTPLDIQTLVHSMNTSFSIGPTLLILAYVGHEPSITPHLDRWTFAATQLNPRMTHTRSAAWDEIVEFDRCNEARPADRAPLSLAENSLVEIDFNMMNPSSTPDTEIERLIQQPRFGKVSSVKLTCIHANVTHYGVITVARHLGERLTHLRLCPIPVGRHTQLPIETSLDSELAIEALARHCPNLQSLNLTSCRTSEEALAQLFKNCTQLESLELRPGHYALTSRAIETLAAHRRLSHLSISRISPAASIGIQAILAACPITRLYLSRALGDGLNIPAQSLCQFIKRQQSSLTEFSYHPSKISKEVLDCLQSCSKLTNLAIEPADDVTFIDLKNTLQRISQLTAFYLGRNLTDHQLLELIPSFQQLYFFTLSRSSPSMNTILAFVDGCKMIRRFCTRHFNPEQLDVLRQLRPHVQFI